MAYGAGRVFLFLQGPHGPFYRRLAARLITTGATVRRVAFNRGDLAEWRGAGPLDAFTGPIEEYPAWLEALVWRHGVTDIVLYGDARPPHQAALALARRRGLLTHCFEEGYLRPRWITYERQGTNGNSPLCALPLPWMAGAGGAGEVAPLPARWGDVRQHLWWSAAYHLRQLLPSRRFRGYAGHRDLPVRTEAAHYLRRLAGAPGRKAATALARRRLRRLAPPFHLVLLQLSFDCSMRAHCRYPSNAAFVREVLEGFAAHAPHRDHLVLKTHPFEDGRERLDRVVARESARLGVEARVHFIDGGGGGLDALLDGARSVLTVNSTAGQQALARGLPLFAAGAAVYARPGLVSSGDVGRFFADLPQPDVQAYRQLRAFMLQTSQIEGSFYSKRGIGRALSVLPPLMLDPTDPYRRVIDATQTTLQPEKRSA